MKKYKAMNIYAFDNMEITSGDPPHLQLTNARGRAGERESETAEEKPREMSRKSFGTEVHGISSTIFFFYSKMKN